MTIRIQGPVRRPEQVSIAVNGRNVQAFAGETLAAALFGAGVRPLRLSPRARTPRGMFCLMRSCQECLVRVDGRTVPACLEPVRDGMVVATGDAG